MIGVIRQLQEKQPRHQKNFLFVRISTRTALPLSYHATPQPRTHTYLCGFLSSSSSFHPFFHPPHAWTSSLLLMSSPRKEGLAQQPSYIYVAPSSNFVTIWQVVRLLFLKQTKASSWWMGLEPFPSSSECIQKKNTQLEMRNRRERARRMRTRRSRRTRTERGRQKQRNGIGKQGRDGVGK